MQASTAVRFFCWQNCRCASGELSLGSRRPMTDVWHFLIGVRIVYYSYQGRVGVNMQVDKGGSTTNTILVPASKSNQRAGYCGDQRNEFCTATWPTSQIGPPPSTPLRVPSIKLDTCGQKCTSNGDCGTSQWSTGCRCVVPKLLLDPVFPVAPTVGSCLKLLLSILAQQGSLVGRAFVGSEDTANFSAVVNETLNDTSIGGPTVNASTYAASHHLPPPNVTNFRDEPLDLESPPGEGTVWYNESALIDYSSLSTLPSYVWCACNCTYTSWGCCAAQDGIVHEPATYNKGPIDNCSETGHQITGPNDLNLTDSPDGPVASNNSSPSNTSSPSDSSSNNATSAWSATVSTCPRQGTWCSSQEPCGDPRFCRCGSSNPGVASPQCAPVGRGSAGGNSRRAIEAEDQDMDAPEPKWSLANVPEIISPQVPFHCLCNCTFMSPACCDVDDGIVHTLGVQDQTSHFRMQTPPEHCCDEETGSVRRGLRTNHNSACQGFDV